MRLFFSKYDNIQAFNYTGKPWLKKSLTFFLREFMNAVELDVKEQVECQRKGIYFSACSALGRDASGNRI